MAENLQNKVHGDVLTAYYMYKKYFDTHQLLIDDTSKKSVTWLQFSQNSKRCDL